MINIKSGRNLYNDNIDSKPVDRDWSEGWGETWEVISPCFDCFEAEELFDYADDYGASLSDDPRSLSRSELIEGLESIGVACFDDDSDEILAAAYGDSMIAGDLDGASDYWAEEVREAFGESDFPMMNYAYPVKLRDDMQPSRAAKALVGLPLTLIYEEESEDYLLALTGGGMDLSDKICRAYIALGLRPPVHFCRIPRMAGTKYSQDFIDILKESCQIAINWHAGTLADLENLSADSDYAEETDPTVIAANMLTGEGLADAVKNTLELNDDSI